MKKDLKTHKIGRFLTKPVRRALMIFLWASFFIISPVVILYTAGYRYDVKANRIRQTGVLSVDVLPKNATVTLNDIKIEKTMPIKLSNRAPGTYSLKIESPGYKTWERDIVIESNNTTYIKGVTLLKDSLPIRLFDSDDTLVEIQGYNDSLVVLKKINGLFELHVLNTVTNDDTLIYRTQSLTNPTIHVSPYTALAYSRVRGTQNDTIYVISLLNTENVETSSVEKDAKIGWNPTRPTEPIYLYENNHVYTLSAIRSKRLIGSASSTLWFEDSQGEIWEAEGITIKNQEKTKNYTFSDTIDSIIDINDARVIATQGDKTMIGKIINNTIESVQTINGTNTFYNRRNGEWLVWSPWELSSIYPDGGVSLLNRSGEHIQEIRLLDENGVILLATEKELSAFNPGYYVRHPLVSIDNYKLVSLNTTKRTIYFLGTFAGRKGLYLLEY